MSMHRRILTIAALLPISLAFAGVSSAGRPGDHDGRFGRHRDRGPERFIEQHADELGLSAETREAIEKIATDSRARSEELESAARADREAMRALLQQPLPDEDAVMDLESKISSNHQQKMQIRLEAMLAIRKLLTEEQRAKLVEIRESRSRHGRRGGPLRACRQDVEDLCAEAARGRDTLECIVERWDMLSDECRASFERGDKPRRRHGTDGDPVED